MSIQPLYHSSDSIGNTKVIVYSDLLHPMEESIGERLKRLRRAKNLSQKELARVCGVAQSTIASVENGTRGYGLSIISIAKALDVTPDHLQMVKLHKVQDSAVDWPFRSFSKKQFQNLDPALREEVEDRLLGAITRQEKTGTQG